MTWITLAVTVKCTRWSLMLSCNFQREVGWSQMATYYVPNPNKHERCIAVLPHIHTGMLNMALKQL